ncbi:MAG TPA: acyl-CoA dehydrogenase family protein [Gammaproteobacteria bacterium]|nr:acyl-CoA dehydrogenase family protein [Gammaproteobacteria bacterium]
MIPDDPLFDPDDHALTEHERELTQRARALGRNVFAARAARFDREARFPTENYRDLHAAGLLAICVPREHGGEGASFRAYMLSAAEIGRYCGATALTWNMHVCSTLWTGPLTDDLGLDTATQAAHAARRAKHYARIVEDGAVYSQSFSEGNAAAAGNAAFATTARRVEGGWCVNGTKIFASLAGNAHYYGILCTETTADGAVSRRQTAYLAVPADAPGVAVTGSWDPLGMRGTVSRNLEFHDVFVAEDEALMPAGHYYQAVTRWPHMFMTLTPTYVGIAQAAYDFTVRYLRGEWPGAPVARRNSAVKQLNVAEMRIRLEQTKALWFRAITDARVDPSREQVQRAYAAQFGAMENANELCQLAIRTCGGQSMLKSLPLERLYRDSRCGSLMLPWSADLCLERLGREALYLPGEQD